MMADVETAEDQARRLLDQVGVERALGMSWDALLVFAAEVEQLRVQVDVLLEARRDLGAQIQQLRALLAEVRESYRNPRPYGFTAIIETDQRRFAEWLAKLDAALAREVMT